MALVAYAVVGTAVGIVARLPYQFGGVGDAARVSDDFLSKGTAVSPPIVALVILIVRSRSHYGRALWEGSVAVCLLSSLPFSS